MKKIMGACILFIFLISIMSVLANEEADTNLENTNLEDKTIEKSNTKEKDMRILEKSKLKNELHVREAVRERLEEKSKDKNVQEKVEKLREKTEDMHKRVQELRERFNNANDKVKEQRDRVHELRTKAEKCKEGEDTCERTKGEWRKGWLVHLERISDVLTSSIERLQEKVESSTMSDEDKTSFTESLTTLQKNLEAKKAAILALENPTAKEVAKEIKEMRDMWKEVQKTKQEILGNLINKQLEESAKKHEEFIGKLEKRITQVKEAEKDSSTLESLLETYKTQVATIKENRDAAKSSWKETENKKEAKDEWKKSWNRAHNEMKESKKTLREFMKEYSSLMKGSDDDSDSEKKDDTNNPETESDDANDDNKEETTEKE
jgi:hypothetical protein